MLNILTIEQQEAAGNVDQPVFDKQSMMAARAHLDRLIRRGAGRTTSEIVSITPEMASLLLARNPEDENRKLSLAIVKRYATDMSAGRWNGLNGQTIVISDDGYLNDGQHRLNAIIEAGVTVPMLVVVGASRESRMTLDQNKVRKSGDYLRMAGMARGNQVASIATNLMYYERGVVPMKGGSPKYGNMITKAEIHEYALAHEAEIMGAIHIADQYNQVSPVVITHLAFALIVLNRAAGDDAVQFVRQVASGESLTRGMAAYHVRNRLQSERRLGQIRPGKVLECMIRGWNAHRTTGRMSRLQLQGRMPRIEA